MRYTKLRHFAAGVVLMTGLVSGSPARADEEEPPPFPAELLGQKEYIDIGKGVFTQICKFCHGKSAYPGKAPKLNPSRYTPEFVFNRVTNGFRGMPSFKEQFTEKERQGVVVYVLSKEFSN
ncbi:MAG: cytochrome c [Betaproteobacteria bacterium]|nr:cytochrome c [Betaproteobacteria bacterium]